MPVSPFGAYLREKRIESGRSLREVAEALSITHVYLGEVERGRRRVLPKKYWSKLKKCIPKLSMKELEALASASEPLDPSMMEGKTRDVVIALARKLESDGISDDLASVLLKILGKKGASK